MFSKLGVDIDAYWCDISGLKSVRACVKQLDIFKATHGHFPAVIVLTKQNIFVNIRGHLQPCWWQRNWIFLMRCWNISSRSCGEKKKYFKLKHVLFLNLTNRVLRLNPTRLLAQRCHNITIKMEEVQQKEMFQHIRGLQIANIYSSD